VKNPRGYPRGFSSHLRVSCCPPRDVGSVCLVRCHHLLSPPLGRYRIRCMDRVEDHIRRHYERHVVNGFPWSTGSLGDQP